jgi:hypothetical protein
LAGEIGVNVASFVRPIGNIRGLFVHGTSANVEVRTRKPRSGLTNNPHHLDGIDMRSPRGRRYRDIVDAIISEFGSSNPVAVRELAGLVFTREQLQAAIVAGDRTALEDLVRVSNLIARRESTMRDANHKADTTPTIAEIAARHRAAKVAAE